MTTAVAVTLTQENLMKMEREKILHQKPLQTRAQKLARA
jgi:hypothetical protein